MWSVTAIAPRPWSRAVASSTSTGVAQSWLWSVCMCRSTSMLRRPFRRAATCGLPVGGVAAGGHLAVAGPRSSSATAVHGRGGRGGVQPRTQRRGRRAAGRSARRACRRRASRTAGRPRRGAGPPRRPPGATRRARRRRPARAAAAPGAGTAPSVAATTMSARAPAPRPRCRPSARAPAGRRAAGVLDDGPRAGVHDDVPRQLGVQAAHARAGTGAAPPRSSCSTKPIVTRSPVRRALERVGARGDDAVVAPGRSAPAARRSPRTRRCARRGARRRAATTLRATCVASDALGRRVEGADVQGARVAQRRRGDAGREGLVDVARGPAPCPRTTR